MVIFFQPLFFSFKVFQTLVLAFSMIWIWKFLSKSCGVETWSLDFFEGQWKTSGLVISDLPSRDDGNLPLSCLLFTSWYDTSISHIMHTCFVIICHHRPEWTGHLCTNKHLSNCELGYTFTLHNKSQFFSWWRKFD